MPFYKKKYTYEEAAPLIIKMKQFLAQNAYLIINDEDPDREWYFYGPDHVQPEHRKIFNDLFLYLQAGSFVRMAPTENGLFIIFSAKAEGSTPTITKTHIRLPKLSHLITLIPQDFFALFKILSTAKNTQSPDTLSLQPILAGIESLQKSVLTGFFLQLRTNYRMNVEYTDKKWTSRATIARIAELEPTQLNQLYAMQYLTAMQNPDLLYFPLETSIDLELDWEQMSDDYCIPQERS